MAVEPRFKVGDKVWMIQTVPSNYASKPEVVERTVQRVRAYDTWIMYDCGGHGGNQNAVFATREEAENEVWQLWLGKSANSNPEIPTDHVIYVQPFNSKPDIIKYIVKGWMEDYGERLFRLVAYPGFKIGICVDVDGFVRLCGFKQLYTVCFAQLMSALHQINGYYTMSGNILLNGNMHQAIIGMGCELHYVSNDISGTQVMSE